MEGYQSEIRADRDRSVRTQRPEEPHVDKFRGNLVGIASELKGAGATPVAF